MDLNDPVIQRIIQEILRRKLPMPEMADPLRGLDRPAEVPPEALPFSQPWRVGAGNRMSLSLPAERGAELGVTADVTSSPFRVHGVGLNYKRSF